MGLRSCHDIEAGSQAAISALSTSRYELQRQRLHSSNIEMVRVSLKKFHEIKISVSATLPSRLAGPVNLTTSRELSGSCRGLSAGPGPSHSGWQPDWLSHGGSPITEYGSGCESGGRRLAESDRGAVGSCGSHSLRPRPPVPVALGNLTDSG